MAKFGFTAILFLLALQSAYASDSPAASPAPPPESGDLLTPPNLAPSPDSRSPASSPSPLSASPPAPVAPSPDLSPKGPISDSPSPAPASPPSTEPSDINHSTESADDSSSGGMSGGKKAGIAIGVIAAVCVVGLAGVVYKKRQENLRRSRYMYSARNEIL